MSSTTTPHSLRNRLGPICSFLKSGPVRIASSPIRTVNSSIEQPGQIAWRTFVSIIHSKCGMRSGCSLRSVRITRSDELSWLMRSSCSYFSSPASYSDQNWGGAIGRVCWSSNLVSICVMVGMFRAN